MTGRQFVLAMLIGVSASFVGSILYAAWAEPGARVGGDLPPGYGGA